LPNEEEKIMLRRLIFAASAALMLSSPCALYALDLVLADFETGTDGWVPNNWDRPMSYVFNYQYAGVTSGNQSLGVIVGRPGWNIAALVKFQDLYASDPAALADLKTKWMAAKTLEVDVTIDPGNWLGRNEVAGEWTNISLLSNSQNGGWATLPVLSDSVNPANPGGWDSTTFKTIQTRHIIYDLSAVNANMKAAGGPGSWFEIFAIVNSGPGLPIGGAFFMDNIKLCGIPKIVFVSAQHASGADANVPGDIGWVNLLRAEGYVVDYTAPAVVGTSTWETLDAAKIAVLDSADLVIVARDNNSGGVATDADEVAAWARVKAPLMLFSPHIARSNRWMWFNSTSVGDRQKFWKLQATNKSHPIFDGVSLDAAGVVQYADPCVASGLISVMQTKDAGYGRVLAVLPENGYVAIAEWDGGTPFYNAANALTPANSRMYFSAGSQEVSGSKTDWGVMNLTPAGQKLFLNAARYMMSPAEKVALVNPSFEDPNAGKIKGWNGEGVGGTPAVDIPGWATDGAVADSGVEQGWGATEGTWTAFLKAGDPSIWQMTAYTVQAGDILTLKVDAKNNWQATLLGITLYYDEVSATDPSVMVRVPVAMDTKALTDVMTTFTMQAFKVQLPHLVGKKVGVELENVSPKADSWIGLDNVRLTVRR
jgi:hypothetical protein